MTNDYTPTTATVRDAYMSLRRGSGTFSLGEFDRWLAEHDKTASARITELEAERDVLHAALTKECHQLASATVHAASALGDSRLAMGAQMVKLGYAGLREQRDKLAAVIEQAKCVDNYDIGRRYWDTLEILAAADTSTAVQAIRAEAKSEALIHARRVVTQYLGTAEKWRFDRVAWAFGIMLGEIPESTPEPEGPYRASGEEQGNGTQL